MMLGYYFVLLVLAFNLGLGINNQIGLFDMGISASIGPVGLIAAMGIVGISIGTLISGLASRFINVDPIKMFGLSSIAGSLLPLFYDNYRVVGQFSATLSGNNPTVDFIMTVVYAIMYIAVFVFFMQLIVGRFED